MYRRLMFRWVYLEFGSAVWTGNRPPPWLIQVSSLGVLLKAVAVSVQSTIIPKGSCALDEGEVPYIHCMEAE